MLDFPPALGSSTQQRLSRPWGLGKQNKPFSQSPCSADPWLPAPLEVTLATRPGAAGPGPRTPNPEHPCCLGQGQGTGYPRSLGPSLFPLNCSGALETDTAKGIGDELKFMVQWFSPSLAWRTSQASPQEAALGGLFSVFSPVQLPGEGGEG